MAMLLYLHQDHFDRKISTFIDPFLGQGGSLIAGFEYGSARIVGIEINSGNLITAKSNLEKYLIQNGNEFELSGDQDSAEYKIARGDGTVTKVDVFRGNSVQIARQVVQELGLSDMDVVSDIPWGCHKCLTFAERRITRTDDMASFYKNVEEALREIGSDRITLAQNSNAQIQLLEAKRITTSKLYDIVMYSLN